MTAKIIIAGKNIQTKKIVVSITNKTKKQTKKIKKVTPLIVIPKNLAIVLNNQT